MVEPVFSSSIGYVSTKVLKPYVATPRFDCVSRGKLTFRDQEKLQLLRQSRQAVGPEAQWAGFYTFGEIGPVDKHNCYHNCTPVVLALG